MEPIGPASVSTRARTVSTTTTSATCNQHAVVNGVRIGTEIGPASTSSGVSGLTLAGSTAVVSRRIWISSFSTFSTAVELVEFAWGDRNSGRDASSSTSEAKVAGKGCVHTAGTDQSHSNLRNSSRNGKVLGISGEGEGHHNFCRKEGSGALSGSSGLNTWIGGGRNVEGHLVGRRVGAIVGLVGLAEGYAVGFRDGAQDGPEGLVVGFEVGVSVGNVVGVLEGL